MTISDRLYESARYAWDTSWDRLFDDRTGMFYDYVSSYDRQHRFDHLPTVEEIASWYPNPNGWVTGMEDSVINGSVMLVAACDRYEATGESELVPAAADMFRGLETCGSISPVAGMVLRSVSPRDCRSYYPETSRDQLTHFAHGLWRYYHSPLADEATRARIIPLMQQLCARLESRIVPEHDYHFGREDGHPGLVDKMWHVMPHEAPRLPMIYIATWDITRDRQYYDLYERYARPAAESAALLDIARYRNCYALLQHQVSLEVLALAAPDTDPLKQAWIQQTNIIADYMPLFSKSFDDYRPVDVTAWAGDFRTWPNSEEFTDAGHHAGYGHVPQWPTEVFNHEFRPVRHAGESLLVRLMAEHNALNDTETDLLSRSLTDVEYDVCITYGMLYPQAAFWRHAANTARAASPPGMAGFRTR